MKKEQQDLFDRHEDYRWLYSVLGGVTDSAEPFKRLADIFGRIEELEAEHEKTRDATDWLKRIAEPVIDALKFEADVVRGYSVAIERIKSFLCGHFDTKNLPNLDNDYKSLEAERDAYQEGKENWRKACKRWEEKYAEIEAKLAFLYERNPHLVLEDIALEKAEEKPSSREAFERRFTGHEVYLAGSPSELQAPYGGFCGHMPTPEQVVDREPCACGGYHEDEYQLCEVKLNSGDCVEVIGVASHEGKNFPMIMQIYHIKKNDAVLRVMRKK